METKELYKFTLDHKWLPALKVFQDAELDEEILKELKELNLFYCCIFCADSVDRINGFKTDGTLPGMFDCNSCKIDHSLCNVSGDNKRGTLYYKFDDAVSRGDINLAREILEEGIKELKKRC